MYQTIKTYGHEVGLSACFRQWRADSHCNKLHGYALAVKLTFQADTPDGRNWVLDFGALKPVKAYLQDLLDHKTLAAEDDPQIDALYEMSRKGLLDLQVLQAVGCEAFARLIWRHVADWLVVEYLPGLKKAGISPPTDLHLAEVEVREHGGNAATYSPL